MVNEQTPTPTSMTASGLVAAATNTATAAPTAVGANSNGTTNAAHIEPENGSLEQINNKSNMVLSNLLVTDWEEEMIASKLSLTEATVHNVKYGSGNGVSNSNSISRNGATAPTATMTDGDAAIGKSAGVRKSSGEGRRGRPPRPSLLPPSYDNGNGDIGKCDGITAGSTFYHGVYSTLSDFYRGQPNSKVPDAKDAMAGNDLLNYYQLVRQFYEQSLEANTNAVDSSNVATAAVTAAMNALNKKPETNGAAPPVIGSEKRPNDLRQVPLFNGVKLNNVSPSTQFETNQSNKSHKSMCKTTPPKKRYSEYNHVEDTGADVVKSNLSHRFDVAALVPDCVNQMTNDNAVSLNAPSTVTTTSVNNDLTAFVPDVRPIASTYLQLMRSMGLTDEDAFKFDHLVSTWPSISILYVLVRNSIQNQAASF